MDEMVKAVQVYAADGSNNIAVKTGDTIEGTISIGDTVTVDGDAKEAFEAALKEFAPDYSKVKLKSKQWGDTDPTATITVDKDGGVKVSYEPEAFATFMDKKSK